MNIFTKSLFVASAALAFAASTTSAEAAESPTHPPMVTVTLGDEVGSEVDYANIWVAEHEGYFAKEGIKIERKTFNNGPEALLQFANGSLDFVVGGLAPFMEMGARGQGFSMLMSVTKYNAPLVGLASIHDWKQLDGKAVGSPGIGTVQDAILSYVENTQHIHFKHVYGKVTGFPVMAHQGEIQAFISWEPAAATALSLDKGLHYIAQRPPLNNAESLELIASPAMMKQHPDVAYRFVKATLEGMQYIKTHPEMDVARIVAAKMREPKAVPVVMQAMKSVDVVSPRVDMPSSVIILKTLISTGKIPAKYGADTEGWLKGYLDYGDLDKAEKQLGLH
ncbi:MAG: ABC transporter substrate-binding protein [Betaproteobacteria bacterium]|nr:ABC transporter substrate-binding protein [Betaproteobacteria bacterium]